MRRGNPRPQRRENGFSLVELMIVLVIIGILVAILIPNLIDATHRAKQRATVGEMRAWGNALGAYMAEIGTLPLGPGAYPGVAASTIHNLLVPYAVSALHDEDKWDNDFLYDASPLSPTVYTVMSTGKNAVPDLCISPASWFNYSEDIKISDGIFVCSPS
jgi:type II secretion system protein G